MLLFSAADVAGIAAATAAYASFEHQMAGLHAQAAVLNRTMNDSQNTFRNYGNVVNGLRNDFPTTTAAAAELVQTLSKFSQFTGSGTSGISALAKVFMQAQGATQESASAIAQSVLQLQTAMGTTSADTGKFTDQLVTMAARSQTSASALADFASQLAPIGRLAGMTQTQVVGVATAFARAGQDGYQASNAFSGMLSDVTRAIQTGSPDLAKYSALLGMTTDQFKSIGASEGILRVFEQLNRMGPDAIQVLNQLGYDGIRTMRAITAVTNQQGGLRGAISQATSAYGDGATAAGAGAGYSGLTASMQRLGEQFKMFGENIGKEVEPAVTGLTNAIGSMAQGVNTFLSGPGGKLVAWGAAAVGALAGVAGAGLSLAAPLLAFAGLNALVRSPLTLGARSGFRGSPVAGAERMAAGEGNFIQRAMYSSGMYLGGQAGRVAGGGTSGISPLRMMAAMPMRGAAMGFNLAADAMSPLGYGKPLNVAGRTFMDGRIPFAQALGLGGFNDPTMRSTMIKSSSIRDFLGLSQSTGQGTTAGLRAWATAGKNPEAALNSLMTSATRTARSMSDVGAAGGKLAAGFGRFTSSLASGMTTMAMVGGRGLGMAAGGLGRFAMSNPFMLAALGLMVAPPVLSALKGSPIAIDDQPGIASSYAQSSGQSLVDITKQTQAAVQSPAANMTAQSLGQVSAAEIAYSTSPSYVFNDDKITQFKADANGYGDYKKIISSQMTYMKGMSPQAMGNIVNDVTSHFGVDAGRDMAMFLAKGQFSVDYGSIFQSLSGPNADVEASQLKTTLAQGVGASTAQSPAAGLGAQYQAISGLVGGSLTDLSRTPGGFRSQKQIDAMNELLQQYLPGADLSRGIQQGIIAQAPRPGTGVDQRTDAQKKKDVLAATLGFMQQNNPDAFASFVSGSMGLLSPGMTTDAMAGVILDNEGQFSSLVTGTQNTTRQLLRSAGQLPAQFRQLFASGEVSEAATSADPSKIFQAGQQIFNRLRYQQNPQTLGMMPGMTNARVIGLTQAAMSSGFAADSPQYQMYQLAQQLAQQQLATNTMFAPRDVKFGTQSQALQQRVGNINLSTDASGTAAQTIQDAQTQFQQMKQDYGSFYQSIAMAEMNFQVQRTRAQQDFSIQRDRMEVEYNLSRTRAEEDYERQRAYAEQDFSISRDRAEHSFQRSQSRATQDYYISRRRQEEDFHHQEVVMTLQAAQSMYDVYQRVTNTRTVSAGSLMTNMQDQLEMMRNQSQGLDQLRGMGLSNRAIQMLGLNDPKNAQQLARFLQDILQNPELIQQFNSQVKQRIKAAGQVMTDPSSMDWKEFTRQFNLARERGQEDFDRSMNRAHRDFEISMHQSEADFQRQMSRQADMFEITMDRQEEDYDRTVTNMEDDFARQMSRAAADLNRMATEISGSFPEIIHKALGALRGQNAEEARNILRDFRNLRDAIGTEADKVNSMLQNKWGVGLNASPGHIGLPGQPDMGQRGGPKGIPRGGGGGTPPRQVVDDSAESLQVFFPLPAGSYSVGTPFGQPGDVWASGYHTGQDFPAPKGTHIMAAMAGMANVAGWAGADSYGNETKLFHGRNQRNQTVETLYGHQSAIRIGQGDFAEGGQWIGEVGDTGNAYGYHLHFELRLDGSPVDPMQLFDGQTVHLTGSDMGGGGPEFNKKKWLNKIWPQLEKAAKKVGVEGGFGYGDISRRFDSASLAAMKKAAGGKGISLQRFLDGGTQRSAGGSAPSGPTDPTGNVALGKSMAANRGWTGADWDALYTLWMHESGWNEHADNPTSSAYGIPQHLLSYGYPKGYVGHVTGSGSGIHGYGGDPATQIKWGLNYIKSRYGDPSSAWDFWQGHNWYAEGGIFSGPQTIGVGEGGPEMVLPLDARGASFIASLTQEMRSANMGVGATPMRCSHNTLHQQIDHRTQYLGDISVSAQDPNEFMVKMKMRKRAENLNQPALATR